jgi:hypothetical protein
MKCGGENTKADYVLPQAAGQDALESAFPALPAIPVSL